MGCFYPVMLRLEVQDFMRTTIVRFAILILICAGVRSAMAGDKVIPISQEEFDELHPGMLVEVHRVGWGVFSTWRLRR